MADIFQEVDEALRQERVEKIWKEYRLLILSGIALIITATAAVSFWRSWDRKQNERETARLVEAIESDAPRSELATLARDTRPGHRAIALLSAAALALEEENPDEALGLYGQVLADKKADPALKDLATLMRVRLNVAALSQDLTQKEKKGEEAAQGKASENAPGEVDAGEFGAGTADAGKAFLAALQPIAAQDGNPWQAHAQLESALIQAHLLGDYEAAAQTLQPLADSGGTGGLSLQQKARQLLHVYRLKDDTLKGKPQKGKPQG